MERQWGQISTIAKKWPALYLDSCPLRSTATSRLIRPCRSSHFAPFAKASVFAFTTT